MILHELDTGRGLHLLDGLPAVLHEPSGSLIVADIHLGYEEYMASTGVYLPRLQLKHALSTIERALEAAGARRLVIAGDLKHAYEKLLRQERVETVKLVEGVRAGWNGEIVVVRGNHDTFIAPLLRKLGVELVEDALDLGNGVMVVHGHKQVDGDADILVMGHEHPTLQVDVSGARVKLPVLLEMPLDNGITAVILPALGTYQTGNPVGLDRRAYLSPIVREHGAPGEALVWVVDREAGTHRITILRDVLESMTA